jgi:hypothetical protein
MRTTLSIRTTAVRGLALGGVAALTAASAIVPAAASEPTFSPSSGPVGSSVTIVGTCSDEGLGEVIQVVVGFYYSDSFFFVSGHSLFHSRTVSDPAGGEYRARLEVGPAVRYTTAGPGPGQPGDSVLRKPKAGDRLFVEAKCYYEGSAFPTYESADGSFTVLGTLRATEEPSITGKPRPGATLTADPGAYKPKPASYRYQWLRNGKAIKGADEAKYRVPAKDSGARVSVRVTATKSGFAPTTATSAAVRIR